MILREVVAMKAVLALSVCVLALADCENLTPTQNRLLGGTAAGATGGAIIGAVAGNAALGTLIGAGVGLAGGAIYNRVKNSEQQSYQEGYAARREGSPPSQ
jgi:osmotically inducible lipoprotein OsmB